MRNSVRKVLTMSTITITATKHAREYVKELYVKYDKMLDRAECLVFDTKGCPDMSPIYERAIKTRRFAYNGLKAVYDALDALGFMPVCKDGTFWRVLDSVTFEMIGSFIREYEVNADSDAASTFRAVLSSFGVTYTDSNTIRYTYTTEER